MNFALRPGESLALVGENGTGKTTLTKLLARLYDPTEGRITLDGRNLREYDLASVRRAIGVIFQDFVRYDLRFDENIGVGEIEEVRDLLDLPGSTVRGVESDPLSAIAASNALAGASANQSTCGRWITALAPSR